MLSVIFATEIADQSTSDCAQTGHYEVANQAATRSPEETICIGRSRAFRDPSFLLSLFPFLMLVLASMMLRIGRVATGQRVA